MDGPPEDWEGPPAAMGRGAPLPAKPYSFVRKHHVYRSGWAFGGGGVVLHCPQTLIPSSGSTTSVGSDEPSAAGTWCFTARNPLFLRPEAPRLAALGPLLSCAGVLTGAQRAFRVPDGMRWGCRIKIMRQSLFHALFLRRC